MGLGCISRLRELRLRRIDEQDDKTKLEETTHGRSLAKGLLAGLIGGLVATAAKTLAEKIYPPRTHGEPEPPEVLAEKIAGHELAVSAERRLRRRRFTGALVR